MGNFTLKITRKGKDPHQWITNIEKRIYPEIQNRLAEVGEITAERMREIIKNSIKRVGSSGRLENSIKSEIVNDVAGIKIGIGRISELPPYWEVINDGGYVPPANRGFFNAPGQSIFGQGIAPQAGLSGEQWIHTGSRADYLLNPKKPIPPIGYINMAYAEMNMLIKNSINAFMKSL